MFDVAMELAEKWKSKAKMGNVLSATMLERAYTNRTQHCIGVYGVLRNELVGEAARSYQQASYIHHRETSREPKIKL